MNTPYIGITGFSDKKEVENILSVMPQIPSRLVMIGILASHKTIFEGIKNKYPNRYPVKDKIGDIFIEHSSVLNLIHYHSLDVGSLYGQLIRIVEMSGPHIHGFQLNILWPLPISLELFKSQHPNQKIILQVGGRAFETIKHSPRELAQKIKNEYANLIDYVLLDLSAGTGKALNTEKMREYLSELKLHVPSISLGVAGGLGHDTLHLIEPLIKEFPNLSIDAEHQIRDEHDNLDMCLAKQYLFGALFRFIAKST